MDDIKKHELQYYNVKKKIGNINFNVSTYII